MNEKVDVLFVNYSDNLVSTVKKVVEKSEYSIAPHLVVTDTTKADFEVRQRHSYRKCSLGMVDDIDIYDSTPLDQDILHKLKFNESICLKMMDRYDDTNGLITYQKRISLYHKLLKYWYNYLIDNKIKSCIFTIVPHVVSDYILYSLCKLLDIPTLMFYRINVILHKNVSLYPLEDINSGIEGLKEFYEGIDLSQDIELTDRFLAYLDLRDHNDKTFTGVEKKRLRKFTFGKAFKSIKYRVNNKVHWYKHGKSYIDFISGRFLRNRYFKDDTGFEKVYEINSLDQNFVYLPLHFQPECSSCPLGGDFVHQDLIIDMLLKAIPDDWIIVVKKHVKPGGKDYTFNRLKHNYRVKVADNRIKSLDLVKRSDVVATITGTAGFEGFLNHKPVLIFGSYFYMDAPNVFRVTQFKELRLAIEHICNSFVPTTMNEIKGFLLACEKKTHRAWVDNRYRSHSGLSDEENSQVLSTLIASKMGEWGILSER